MGRNEESMERVQDCKAAEQQGKDSRISNGDQQLARAVGQIKDSVFLNSVQKHATNLFI